MKQFAFIATIINILFVVINGVFVAFGDPSVIWVNLISAIFCAFCAVWSWKSYVAIKEMGE